MLNLLISIDFSENGQQVALCAAEAAQQAKVRLILFHEYNANGPTAEEGETDTNSERYVQTQLDKLARKLHGKTGVSITRLMKPSASRNETLEVARLVKADLTVICDHNLKNGHGAILSENSGMPVITVPTSNFINSHVLKRQLSDHLKGLQYPAASLLEAI